MNGINPVSPVGPGMRTNMTPGVAPKQAATGASGFANTLRGYVEKVDDSQQVSSSAIEDLLTGNKKDLLPAVIAVAKADLSFKLLIGVRNKVVEAYKQTMNMQI